MLAAEEETALGSVAWNLSLSPASLSPDTRLTSNAELLSIDSLAPSGHLSKPFWYALMQELSEHVFFPFMLVVRCCHHKAMFPLKASLQTGIPA